MASMIYGISRNGTRGISYDSDEESTSEKDDKPKTIHSHFPPLGNKMVLCLKVKCFKNLRLKQKLILVSTMHTCTIILHRNPNLSKTLGRLTKKDLKSFGYLRIRSSMLQTSLATQLRHQSWYLHSGCLRHMTGRRHMFQSLKLNHGGVVGFGGD